MPQVDLESPASSSPGASYDREIACKTLADGKPSVHDNSQISDNPPDSFWLSVDAELDWLDRNAFHERQESTKGYSNSTNLNPHINRSNSVSHRFSVPLKSKASIIGLPRSQKSCFSDAKFRRNIKPPKARLFPKRSEKTAASLTEPSSPKVSCMGRVRSKKDRSRRSHPAKKNEKTCRKRRTKIWNSLTGFFRSSGKQKPYPVKELPDEESKSAFPQQRNFAGPSPTSGKEIDPPGLGSAIRFASGRRSDSWGLHEVVPH